MQDSNYNDNNSHTRKREKAPLHVEPVSEQIKPQETTDPKRPSYTTTWSSHDTASGDDDQQTDFRGRKGYPRKLQGRGDWQARETEAQGVREVPSPRGSRRKDSRINHRKNRPNDRPYRGENRRRKSFPKNKGALLVGRLPEAEGFDNFETLEQLANEIADPSLSLLDFISIDTLPLNQLIEEAKAADIKEPLTPNREDLINRILLTAFERKRPLHVKGVLDTTEKGYGILTYEHNNYRLKDGSTFLPAAFIQAYGLQKGHIIEAQIHPPREGENCPFAVKILSVMGEPPEHIAKNTPFNEQTPYYPLKRLFLETDEETNPNNLSMRILDVITPIGFGQRGLIVAPPRTGKTVLLQGIARSIQVHHPEAHLTVLLIDERPEEVTDFRRQVQGKVISSTFDESAENHCHVAEMVIKKSRRMVESGGHVIILLDSITRLARAYNTMSPSSGKILSGGVEASALQKPKCFFGSARNIEGNGSLTILATALVETGSRMDEVIFEEFKGTGNMEIHLDRALVDKRIFPSISLDKSGTRKEELLYHPDEITKIYSLRRAMKGIPPNEAMEMLIERVKKTKTNVEFLMSINS